MDEAGVELKKKKKNTKMQITEIERNMGPSKTTLI